VATLCIGAVVTCMSISVQYVSSLLLSRHVVLFMEVIFFRIYSVVIMKFLLISGGYIVL